MRTESRWIGHSHVKSRSVLAPANQINALQAESTVASKVHDWSTCARGRLNIEGRMDVGDHDRPTLSEIRAALDRGVGGKLPGQNSYRLDEGRTRVIIDEDEPRRSTSYYTRQAPDDSQSVEHINGRTFTVHGLANGWEREITRLAAEMLGLSGGELWGAHDYFGALHLRDRIEDGLRGPEHPQDQLVDTTVAKVDWLLRAITEEDHRGLVIRYGDPVGDVSSRWWWQRILTGGQVRQEVDSWYANEQRELGLADAD